MDWTQYDKVMLALTMWREARGEGAEGMRAVGHVIANRVAMANAPWDHVITKKWQFSSITAVDDPQLGVWPEQPDATFDTAMQLIDGIYNYTDTPDPTHGATHYFNPHIVLPSWASLMVKVATIGNHDFYKAPTRI